MHKLRVAVGTNDGITLANSHLGDTSSFHIYDITSNGENTFITKKENNAQKMEHSSSNNIKYILDIIKDSDVLVARQKSPNFINIAKKTKYQPVIINDDSFETVLIIITNSFKQISELVIDRKNGKIFTDIPVLKK